LYPHGLRPTTSVTCIPRRLAVQNAYLATLIRFLYKDDGT